MKSKSFVGGYTKDENWNKCSKLGAYMGFDMIKNFKSYENKVEIILKGEMGHRTEIGTDALGNITRLNNTLNSMTTNLEKVEQAIKETIKQLEKAKIEVSKPFEKEDELQKKMSRLSELDAMLDMDMEEEKHQEQDESGKEELKEPKKISVREVLARKKEEVAEQRKEREIAKTEKLGGVMV